MRQAMITGLAGWQLGPNEAAFLRDARPAGLIVFARNVDTPDQLRALIGEARSAIAADDVLVLVDQEGGRVQRLAPPHWRSYPPARSFGDRLAVEPEAAAEAARRIAELMADDLRALGINVNCVPCADRPVPGAHDIIGTRAYATDTPAIVRLAEIVAAAHIAIGVVPVVKHIPGHGRAGVDSHLALPVVDTPRSDLRTTDFAPFKALNHLPAAMTAHVVYTDLDARHPATTSPTLVRQIIRKDIGFAGLLMSDDLSMRALSGSLASRATAAIRAGCDIVLHCNGDLAEMTAVADATPRLAGAAQERFRKCVAITTKPPFPLDKDAAVAVLQDHMQASGMDNGKLA